MEKSAFIAHIAGMVQGVGFRYFTYRQATAKNIKGYVKNLPDGRVKVFAEGSKSSLEELLEDLRHGPSTGDVNEIDVEWKSFEEKYDKFSIQTDYGY